MAYKNAKITPAHVRHVVRKCWRLWEAIDPTDQGIGWGKAVRNYLDQRELAERAIAALPEEQRKEFELP